MDCTYGNAIECEEALLYLWVLKVRVGFKVSIKEFYYWFCTCWMFLHSKSKVNQGLGVWLHCIIILPVAVSVSSPVYPHFPLDGTRRPDWLALAPASPQTHATPFGIPGGPAPAPWPYWQQPAEQQEWDLAAFSVAEQCDTAGTFKYKSRKNPTWSNLCEGNFLQNEARVQAHTFKQNYSLFKYLQRKSST